MKTNLSNDSGLHGVSAMIFTSIVLLITTSCSKPERPSKSLQEAILSGNTEVVRLLLRNGADPNASQPGGMPPLETALRSAMLMLEAPSQEQVVQYLLDAGADPNVTCNQGYRPLHVLVETCPGYGLQIAEVLIKKGANVNLTNAQGFTSLDLAKSNCPSLVSFLYDNGAVDGEQISSAPKGSESKGQSESQAGIAPPHETHSSDGHLIPITDQALTNMLSLARQHIARTGLFDGDWRIQNSVCVSNRVEVRPFQKSFVLWDTATGRIKTLLLNLTAEQRPSHELDPYFSAEDILTKKFGPSDIQSFNLSLLAKDEAEWQLPRTGIFLKRTPHAEGHHESVDYELGVAGKDEEFVPKQIEGAFGFTLGRAMSQNLLRAVQRLKGGDVMVGVRASDPHPLLSVYALFMTPRTGKVYQIVGMSEGNTGPTADVFKRLLKEARSTYDWDSCKYEKSHAGENVRLEKGDRSIVVSFSSGESGRVSASIRFLDGKIMDDAVLESRGF